MPKSNKERQKDSDNRHKALNRKQSKWWLTDSEKIELKAKLAQLRKGT